MAVVAVVAVMMMMMMMMRPVAAGLAVERSGVPEPEATGWVVGVVGVVVVEREAAGRHLWLTHDLVAFGFDVLNDLNRSS